MPTLTDSSEVQDQTSPVEERHIDYILEEEFIVDSQFLAFFLARARSSASDATRIVQCVEVHGCNAVRSATTSDGESDLLVIYGAEGPSKIAILIEDKIRADFQPSQAERYRKRGDAGVARGTWSAYWTCLVAHSKYATTLGAFDAVVTLEDLHHYFASREDPRSRFRARVLQQTIKKFEATGIKIVDQGMTHFRALYASMCDAALPKGKWTYEAARDAWWDDNWFNFRGTDWPKGVKITHMARRGRMLLILPLRDPDLFNRLITEQAAWHPNGIAPEIKFVLVGKAKAAFQIDVPPIEDFGVQALSPEFEEFFAVIGYLADFYGRISGQLPEGLRLRVERPVSDIKDDSEERALRAMVLGFMRSIVTTSGTAMPYPLPDMEKLTAATPPDGRYFASLGMMGGFQLELRKSADGSPYIISAHWSRQWGGDSSFHKITTSEIVSIEPPTDWYGLV